jgi:hypothetical protein
MQMSNTGKSFWTLINSTGRAEYSLIKEPTQNELLRIIEAVLDPRTIYDALAPIDETSPDPRVLSIMGSVVLSDNEQVRN